MNGLTGAWRWLATRWRQSLLLSVTLLGVAGVAALALVLARVVGHQIESDALNRAQATAELVARSSFAPRLPQPGKSLTPSALHDLDAQVAAARASQPGTAVALIGLTGRVLYANGMSGRAAASTTRTGTHVVGNGGGRIVRTMLPVRVVRGGPLRAFLEVEIPYAPIAHDIQARTRRLDLVLTLTAIGAYLLVLPVLLRARRAVRAQYDPRRMQLAQNVRRAIKQEHISLAFQPIVASDTHAGLRSVEALVRWTDPHRGIIAPATFIPALETTETIWDLTSHVFELAFRQCTKWHAEGHDIPVALNLSAAVLLDRRLVPELCRLVDACSFTPAGIELEITEGALVQDARDARRVLEQIAGIGLRVIAIDDFGTGYSSLARLHELPLDTLKIDQSFVKRMATEGDDAIVRSVVDLAHALGLDVIAEGVEDELTAARLHELGAEYLQGYYVSRPLSPAAAVEWLHERRGVPFVPGEAEMASPAPR